MIDFNGKDEVKMSGFSGNPELVIKNPPPQMQIKCPEPYAQVTPDGRVLIFPNFEHSEDFSPHAMMLREIVRLRVLAGLPKFDSKT